MKAPTFNYDYIVSDSGKLLYRVYGSDISPARIGEVTGVREHPTGLYFVVREIKTNGK